MQTLCDLERLNTHTHIDCTMFTILMVVEVMLCDCTFRSDRNNESILSYGTLNQSYS